LLRDAAHARNERSASAFRNAQSAGGGGGIGIRLCENEAALEEAYESVQRLSETHFKGSGIYLERFVSRARHIEVQIFGDGQGGVLALGERDCSVQRPQSKIIEETPAPDFLLKHARGSLKWPCESCGRFDTGRPVPSSFSTIRPRRTSTFSKSTRDCKSNTALPKKFSVLTWWNGWCVLADGSLPPLASFSLTPNGASIQVRLYAENRLMISGRRVAVSPN